MKSVLGVENVKVEDRLMFLGQDLSVQRYDQFKYPKFFDLWVSQNNFFWRPERIELTKDRTDYERLDDTERFVFETNLRWQTMTDSMLSRSIHQISQYVTNPELELCLGIWAAMENVHSFSYTHILKNITKNASVFFDSILEDKEILKRSKEIKSSYDKLLGDSEDLKENIFDAVLSTQITEGVSFYTSFICSFFFGYKGVMEGNAKIVGEIARDENLHVAITNNIIKNWKERPEEGFQDILKSNEDKIYGMYEQAVNNEKSWAEYLFSKGSLLGLNPEILKRYVEWLANSRLHSLGYKKIFETKINPVSGWTDRYFNSQNIQVAPQETQVESYLTGAADTSLNEDLFKFEL